MFAPGYKYCNSAYVFFFRVYIIFVMCPAAYFMVPIIGLGRGGGGEGDVYGVPGTTLPPSLFPMPP